MLALRRNPWLVRRPSANPFDRLFDEFFSDSDRSFGQLGPAFSPKLDVSEIEEAFKVSAELPGLDEADLDVSLERGVLTISGEKKSKSEDKGENYHRVERRYGSFKRSVRLPVDVQLDRVEAVLKNGLLTVTLPKVAEAREDVKKIDVNAS